MIFLSYCSVSPLHPVAAEAVELFHQKHQQGGLPELMPLFVSGRERFTKAAAELLQTSSENISAVHSTAAACNQIALSYPFKAGDEIVLYEKEYPSNYFPWLLAAKRSGAALQLVPDSGAPTAPGAFSLAQLRDAITPQTRIVAISHVQYANGFCVDIEAVAQVCREKQVDLVIDATQSMGALAVYPEKLGAAAVVSSGWKWLMGPHGIAVLYTSPAFREKLGHSHGGPQMMEQGYERLLDLCWTPWQDARRFEYSTLPAAYIHGLAAVLRKVFLAEGIERIEQKLRAHRDYFLGLLNPELVTPLQLPEDCGSGITSLVLKGQDPEAACKGLEARGVYLTARGGYVRFAPHFITPSEQLREAAEIVNEFSAAAQ